MPSARAKTRYPRTGRHAALRAGRRAVLRAVRYAALRAVKRAALRAVRLAALRAVRRAALRAVSTPGARCMRALAGPAVRSGRSLLARVSYIRRYSLGRKVCNCGWSAAEFSWKHGDATDAGSGLGGTDDRENTLKDAFL